jgi:bacterioferritin
LSADTHSPPALLMRAVTTSIEAATIGIQREHGSGPAMIAARRTLRIGTRRREKEQSMTGDKQAIEYLNKALRHELTAVNQYWLHYRLLDNWGYKVLAKAWRKESIEEMQHADKLIERIIFLDGSPNMQTLESLHIGKTVKAVLESDLQAELSAHSLYADAATHCHSVKDYVTRDLFEQLMHDEEEHIDFLETQIELVARIGLELYAQRHIGEVDED